MLSCSVPHSGPYPNYTLNHLPLSYIISAVTENSIQTDSLTASRQQLEEAIRSSQATNRIGIEAREKFERRRGINIGKLGEESIYSLIPKNIDSTKLLASTMNALQRNGVKTLRGLAQKNEKQLIELEGIGDKRMSIIRPLRQLAVSRQLERISNK